MTRPDELVEMVPAELDTRQRWVRVTGQRGEGFIEFDFAIGEPDLCVEMILPAEAFAEFCAANRVELLPPEKAAGSPAAGSPAAGGHGVEVASVRFAPQPRRLERDRAAAAKRVAHARSAAKAPRS